MSSRFLQEYTKQCSAEAKIVSGEESMMLLVNVVYMEASMSLASILQTQVSQFPPSLKPPCIVSN